jgi:hypothetical protein
VNPLAFRRRLQEAEGGRADGRAQRATRVRQRIVQPLEGVGRAVNLVIPGHHDELVQ